MSGLQPTVGRVLGVPRGRLGVAVWVLAGTLAGMVPEVRAASVIATIPVGTNPHGVAANPLTNRIYVANIGSNTVSVINSATNGVIATVPVGVNPFGVAVNRSTNRIYVVNAGANTVSVIDGVTNTVIGAPIGVGTGPEGVAVNESTNKVYVAIFNAFTGTTVSVIDGTGPGPGTFLYNRTVGTAPNGVAVNRTTNRIYVSNYNSNTVSVLDGSAADAVVATIPVGANPNSLDVDRTTNRVYVANTGPDTLTVINGATDTVIPPPIPVGLNPDGVAVSSAGKKAYVANNVGDSVSIVNTVINVVEQTLTVGDQPREIAFNSFNRRSYVANYGSASVSVIEDPSVCCDLGTTETDIPGPPVNRRIQVTGSGRFRLRFDRLTGGTIDQFFDLVEDAGATLDLAGGSGASFNSYPSLYTNDVWYTAFPAPTPAWFGWASGDGVTPDSKLELIEATATRVKVRQEAFLHHSLDPGPEYRMPGMKAFGDYSIYGVGRLALKFKRQTTVAVTWGSGASSSDSGWNVHWESAGALNSWTAYNNSGQLFTGAPVVGGTASNNFLLVKSDYTATSPNVKTDFLAISQDWPNANQTSWDEVGAPDNAGLAGWSDTGSIYSWNPGDSESFNYLTYFKPTNLGSGASPQLDPAVTTRATDYRTPGTVSAVGPGTRWQDPDEGTSAVDAFNESEAAYLFESHPTQGLVFTLSASPAAPRYSPFLKVRHWRFLQDPPAAFAGGLKLTNDVEFKADVKPLSRGHFANSLAWHCTGQDAASCMTPDVGSGGNLIVVVPSSIVPARYGRALSLASNDSYYSAPAADFNFSTGAVEFWYQPNYDSTNLGAHMLWFNQGGGGTENDCFSFEHTGGNLVVRAYESASDVVCNTSGFNVFPPLTVTGALPGAQYFWRAGDWVHLRVEWDNTIALRVYVDGRLVGSTGAYPLGSFTTSTTRIGSCFAPTGCPGGGASRNADGIIDEPHIYVGGIASGNPATYGYAGLVGDSREKFADSSMAQNVPLINLPVGAGNKGQYLYFGADSRFHGLNMSFQTPGGGVLPGALVWQYWRDNGAGTEKWEDLEAVTGFADGTADFSQNGTIKWDADPTEWKLYSVNGGPDLYYVRVYLVGGVGFAPIPVESLIKTDILLFQYCGDFTTNVTISFATPAPTAVKLQSFGAAPGDGSVVLEWRTASELDNLGFHVYRAPSENGPWTRLTPSLIPGLGSSAVGQAYSFRDTGLTNGTRYFYRLDDVDASSKTTSHGPVSAVPNAAAPPSDGGTGADGGGKKQGGSFGSCPDWVLTAYGSLSGASSASASLRCTRHGDPEATSLGVLSRDSRSATLELRTGGFYALHTQSGAGEPAGTVRVFVPGFDFPQDEKAAALPIRRALTDAVVGRRVQLGGVRALDLARFNLVPSALGKAEMQVGRDGTVRAARRGSRPLARQFPRGELVTLLPSLFQGEQKSAVVEIAPLRFDAERQQLVLAKRVRVRLRFTGREAGESGRGSLGRAPGSPKPASGEILARLFTTGRGLHAVSFEQLFPGRPRGFAASQLRLERQGEPVGFHLEPSADGFGPGSRLFFFADRTAASTDFTAEVAYQLVRARDGLRMPLVSGAPSGDAIRSASTGYVSFETNRFYQPGLLDAPDSWLWEVLASGATRVKSFSLTGVDAASGTAELDVFLQGGSESGQAVDHHVSVSVNGTLAGEVQFAGKKPYRMSLSVPVSLLRDGPNDLSLTNVADIGVSSFVFLDRFDVSYPQLSATAAGRLEGTWSEGGSVAVASASAPIAVLDVTSVRWLSAFDTAGGALRFRAEAGRRYLAVSAEALLAPRVVTPEPATLRAATNQADYLLIAPRAFLAAAEPLLQRRADQGLTTRAAAFEEIADQFGHGQPSAEAVRSFLAFAFHSWARPSPRYVLLLGDSTYDPRNFIGTSQPSPLPALWAKTSYLWTVSDPLLAAVNGQDSLPDIAIGRLPATTVEEAQLLVDKLLAWEDSGQGLTGRAALVADNPDIAGDFEADVHDIAQSYLAGRNPELVLLSELGSQTRPRILDALNSGLSFLNYVGHGGAAVWASENVWNSWDAASLQAQSQQPLLVTMNCLNGYFVAPSYNSLAESLLKADGRGAIASFSPSGLSLDGPAHQYHRALMAALTSEKHQRLGDAVLAAQKAYAQTGLMPELLSIYHLLGDPALEIR